MGSAAKSGRDSAMCAEMQEEQSLVRILQPRGFDRDDETEPFHHRFEGVRSVRAFKLPPSVPLSSPPGRTSV